MLGQLERLAAHATPGPWYPAKNHTAYDGYGESVFSTEQTHNLDNNLAYITAACNSLPTLIAENAALKKHCEWLEQNLNLKNTVVDDLKNELRDALERC